MSSSTSESDHEDLQQSVHTSRIAKWKSHPDTLSDKLGHFLSSPEHDEAVDSPSEEDGRGDYIEGRLHEDLSYIADTLEPRRHENKTFSGSELREIERRNGILMDKILRHNRRASEYKTVPVRSKETSSSINRRNKQTQIERDNMILLKKIQSVKAFGMSRPKK